MATDLLDRKFRRRFALLDATGDGYIDEDDYRVMIRRLTAATGLAAGSAKATVLESALLAWWSALREAADADGDGRISAHEYAAAVHGSIVAQEQAFAALGRPVCRALVDAADADDDGRITQDQFVALMGAFGVDEAHSARTFAALDADGDGLIGHSEFDRAAHEFFTSQAPDAVGNVLWGEV